MVDVNKDFVVGFLNSAGCFHAKHISKNNKKYLRPIFILRCDKSNTEKIQIINNIFIFLKNHIDLVYNITGEAKHRVWSIMRYNELLKFIDFIEENNICISEKSKEAIEIIKNKNKHMEETENDGV